jgi:hypothetical protein
MCSNFFHLIRWNSPKIQNIEDTQKVQLKDIDIEQSNLTHEQIAKVTDLLDKNSDIFCKNDLDLVYGLLPQAQHTDYYSYE